MEKVIKKSDFLKVLISGIVVEEGFNVREDYGDIDALAQQIAAQGQKQPLKGKRVKEQIILTAGHRRFEAIKLANEKYGANIERVDVISEKSSDKARIFEMLIDGDGAKPLSNKEMVKGIKRLLDMGVAKKEIITSLGMGKSQAQNYNLVSAAQAPDLVQKMIDDELISIAKVNALQRKAENDEELVEMAQDFVDNKGKEVAPKVSADVAKLEKALALVDPTLAKAALVKVIINKLKSKSSAEDIAKLLK